MIHKGGNDRPQITCQQKAAFRWMLENNSRVSSRYGEQQKEVSEITIQRSSRHAWRVFRSNLQVGAERTYQNKQSRVHFTQYTPSRPAND